MAAALLAAAELPLLAVVVVVVVVVLALLALLPALLLRRRRAELSAPRPLTAGQNHAAAPQALRLRLRLQAEVQALRGTASSRVDRNLAVAFSPSSWAESPSRHMRPPC